VYGADIGQYAAFNEARSFAEPLLESIPTLLRLDWK